ncbi:MAG TPA: sensor histidine kinase [Gammaproteobacteria bacterium]|nr:sensor histidine kinase [Gammaproteobacteria bacterium]
MLANAAFCLLATASLHAQTLDLYPDRPDRSLASIVRYVQLPGSPADTLPQARALPASAYAPIGKRYIDFGSTPDTIWLRLELHNASATATGWVLSFNARFMTELTAFLDGGSRRVLLRQTERSTFGERPIRHRFLAVPFSLEADERAELLIGYRSKGGTALPLSIETPASYDARYAREDAINLAAYAAVAFLIVLTVLQAFAFRQPSQKTYALYLGATLAYILHMDGLTFEYLWPGHPVWNSYAAVPFGCVMSITALMFGRSFVETRRVAPAYDKLMLALIVVAAVTNVGGLVASEAAVKGFAYLIASLTAAACLGAAVLAYLRKRSAMRFFVLGWTGVFSGVFATSLANNFSALIPRTTANMIPKLTIMFDALMFYMALADRARAWRVERDYAQRREVEALQKQQEIAERLHDAERERLEALIVAQTKSRQLAMASHDIRQPLTSLRLTLDRLAGSGDFGLMAAGFKQSIDYLDRLTKEYSEEARLGENGGNAEDGESGRGIAKSAALPTTNVFDVESLLQNVDLMFREEAEAKGLAFRCRGAGGRVRGDAMAAMRIVSNLVANAIKYTRRGKILVGCRRRAAHITVVVADTGPGIPLEELDRVLEPRVRGSTARDTVGEGLGLGIASALAEQHGYAFRCRSKPGRGTAFFVDLPSERRESAPAASALG